MQLDAPQILVGIAEIAVALAGFSGVVVVFGSRSQGHWRAGDRLRLSFLLEASLTAGGFALAALVLVSIVETEQTAWAAASGLWALFMPLSLYSSRRRIIDNRERHGDIDTFANRLVFGVFATLVLVQVANVFLWRQFAPVLAALCVNIVGAAMQFARLIRSAFHD